MAITKMTSREFNASLIGATALVHGMAVVTRNVADFERFAGLEVINPWG